MTPGARRRSSSLLACIIVSIVFLVSLVFSSRVIGVDKVIAYWLTGLSLSLVGLLAYYRGLEFLVSGSIHNSFLAATLGYIFALIFGVNIYYSAIPVGLMLTYLAGYLIHRGIDPNKVSSFMVSFSSSMGVLLAYYVLTMFPAQYSLSSIMLGDPVLMSRQDVLVTIVISIIVVTVVILIYNKIILLSIDPVSARIAGVRIGYYDFITYTLIGLATIGLLRISGYIMEHVMILLPAIVGARISRSSKEHLLLTLLVSTTSTMLGYVAAVNYGLSPVGVSGFILVIAFLYVALTGWGR
ncbi:metal ABC transporter permease [Desulfurococcus amylolyticus]|uniref:metal ABC transporter permease n=1 Tax=Desulfurococcus amylolyticus TaxID=94694 RepID=UPI0005B22211|nr:metal ABC transporter permease [Desulfurococcus amylolyticus]